MKAEAKRMHKIPPYLFARIEQKIAEAKEAGVDIISLGIGDPDSPTPQFIIDAMIKELSNTENHQYPSSAGMMSYRQAVADWYKRRFEVDLDPKTEICSLIGSKEGIANIHYCYVDPGDVVLVPDPAYPVYSTAAMLAGGEPYYMPLDPQNGFLPDLKAIPSDILNRAKILWLNYPNNPTGAIADISFLEEALAFAKEHDILICFDNAYSEMTYDDYVAPSILQLPGAKDVAIEFNSCSKPFNMTGWRIAWVAGNAKAVAALARYKSNVDSGAFQAVQYAGIAGLNNSYDTVESLKKMYAARRDILVGGLNDMGWNLPMPKATFYVWAPVPKGYTSASFAEFILEKAGVIITPGNGYGAGGEGYFRATLTVNEDRMKEAIARMKKVLKEVIF
ncbi:MAG: LL-diaminopimelate aminotransferase [Bacillota bacterium]|jgi:LL-diaminopimelate aminotransferase